MKENSACNNCESRRGKRFFIYIEGHSNATIYFLSLLTQQLMTDLI